MRADAVNETIAVAQAAPDADRPLWQDVSRRRAAGTHLAGSAVVVGTVCALIFLVWYPDPYFQATGAWSVLRILIGVDLVLGPLLTLIVFKAGKPGLKFDLCVIAAVQLAALVYGVAVIYNERPYYTVFAVDRFNVLARGEVDPTELADPALMAVERIGTKPWRGPLLVVATRPNDAAGLNRLLEETLFEGKADIERRPLYWDRYSDQRAQVLERALPLAQLKAVRSADARTIERVAERLGRTEQELAFLPVIAKNRDLTMLIDSTTGLPLGVVDVDPWLSKPAAN